jgi:transposase
MLLADRGYDADWIRALAAEKVAWANIPPRCNRNEPISFSPHLYRAGNLVERFFNKIKHCRRVATRYDKLAANYLAFVQLASIRLWLRVNEARVLACGCSFYVAGLQDLGASRTPAHCKGERRSRATSNKTKKQKPASRLLPPCLNQHR